MFMIVAVAAVQLGIIFLFGDYRLPRPRKPAPSPSVAVARNSDSELLALSDPTLFALPNEKSFAGKAWMHPPQFPQTTNVVTDEPFWLPMSVERLGENFADFIETHSRRDTPAVLDPAPAFSAPQLPPPNPAPAYSMVRLNGALTRRRLLNALKLPVLAANDLLTNSIVSVAVTPEGDVFSTALLSSSSSPEADGLALRGARSARFNSIAPYGIARNYETVSNLAWGSMVFEWQTVPAAATNSLPAAK
jgi:hypothetical protein